MKALNKKTEGPRQQKVIFTSQVSSSWFPFLHPFTIAILGTTDGDTNSPVAWPSRKSPPHWRLFDLHQSSDQKNRSRDMNQLNPGEVNSGSL